MSPGSVKLTARLLFELLLSFERYGLCNRCNLVLIRDYPTYVGSTSQSVGSWQVPPCSSNTMSAVTKACCSVLESFVNTLRDGILYCVVAVARKKSSF